MTFNILKVMATANKNFSSYHPLPEEGIHTPVYVYYITIVWSCCNLYNVSSVDKSATMIKGAKR